MKIVLGADHGGFILKNFLADSLRKAGHEVTDIGTESATAVDYPDYSHKVALGVLAGTYERGILVCGTGVGMSIAANRHHGVRAVNCTDTFTARFARLHNDANVLCLGERVLGPGLAEDIVRIWLETKFEKVERHEQRVAKIELAGVFRR